MRLYLYLLRTINNSIYIMEYIEVSLQDFNPIIKKAIQLGITEKASGGFMGCVFWYGDKAIFKESPHIIAMSTFNEYEPGPAVWKYNLTKDFKDYMGTNYPECKTVKLL